MTQHPMVPPKILLNNWESDWFNERENVDVLLIQAYQAGADAELKACCEWLAEEDSFLSTELRTERRPKLLSLKEQALTEFDSLLGESEHEGAAIILRALESIPDQIRDEDFNV